MFWVLLLPLPVSRPFPVLSVQVASHGLGIQGPESTSQWGHPKKGEILSGYQGSTGDRVPTQQLLEQQLSGELCFWMSQNRFQPWALAAGSLDAGSSANMMAYKMERPEHAAAGASLLLCSGPCGSVVHNVTVSTRLCWRGVVPSAQWRP